MVTLRAQKIANIAQDYPALTLEGNDAADVLLIGWGSTYGTLKSAIHVCNNAGTAVALIHLRYLNPLPEELGRLLSQFKTVLVAELNTGQLCQLLRANYLVDAKSISQCNGLSFTVNGIVSGIQAVKD